ncbi:MAG: response regulator [Ramlibacter sp.]|nr:response regulator [Ramlibacter sp.]
MSFLSRFWEEYKGYYSHDRPVLKFAGYSGAVAFPVFYMLQQLRSTHPYDSAVLRTIAALMFLMVALRDYWPARLKPFYLPWTYATLLYGLPFFFIFMSLKNTGGVVSVANTFMAVFFLILLTDWRNTIAMLLIGAGLATVAYMATTPHPTVPVDYIGRLPPLILVVICGSLFKFTEKQIQAERLEAVRALAGSIAHEMRTPLGQIKHMLESMQQALPPPTATAQAQTLGPSQVDSLYRHVAQSEIAVKRGLQVIAMTLDEVSAKPVDTIGFSYLSAAEATSKAVQEYVFESDAERHRVKVDVLSDFNFRGDETAYLFVLFNLIKNAMYYLASDVDARVTITVAHNQVRVRDTGPGMSADALARLFRPFSSVGKTGGTGLGLAYCQRVMQAFGGDITCESVPGEYTEFALSFAPVTDEEELANRLAPLARAQAAFAGKRLLIVDDDAAQRVTTRHKLAALGAEIDQAADGRRALDALSRQRYDLVLLDLNMPVLDGYAVAQRVRQGQMPVNRDVCIVAYTSEPSHIAGIKTHKAGMDGFVNKPCSQPALVQALHQALIKRRVRPDTTLVGRRVLLADDSALNRRAVAAYLRHAGATVVEVGHGQAVLEQLRLPGGCDAILMDINMPGMSGVQTAQAIRNSASPFRNVPIVALTAHSDDATSRAASQAGMNSFITKPVEAGVLYRALHDVLCGEPAPLEPSSAPGSTVPAGALLDVDRLESYRRIGMLEELLSDYMPEIERLVERLEGSAGRQDLPQTLDALHSLLGMSGEAGGSSLHELVRSVYVPMVETGAWPAQAGWLQQIRATTLQTQQALKAHAAMHAAG